MEKRKKTYIPAFRKVALFSQEANFIYIRHVKYCQIMKSKPREESIGAQMAIALQLMRRQHSRSIVSKGYEITLEQLAVLEILSTHGEMNMTELSKTVWKQNANITRIVDKLEKRKLLIRKSVLGDRRANMISITDHGEHVFSNVIAIIIQGNEDMLSCISKKEEAVVLFAMKKIINHLS